MTISTDHLPLVDEATDLARSIRKDPRVRRAVRRVSSPFRSRRVITGRRVALVGAVAAMMAAVVFWWTRQTDLAPAEEHPAGDDVADLRVHAA